VQDTVNNIIQEDQLKTQEGGEVKMSTISFRMIALLVITLFSAGTVVRAQEAAPAAPAANAPAPGDAEKKDAEKKEKKEKKGKKHGKGKKKGHEKKSE
jgi:hypothetical protein